MARDILFGFTRSSPPGGIPHFDNVLFLESTRFPHLPVVLSDTSFHPSLDWTGTMLLKSTLVACLLLTSRVFVRGTSFIVRTQGLL